MISLGTGRRLLFSFLLGAALHAQTGSTSAVTGSVRDPQNAPIAGAKVTLRNPGTGTVRDVITSSTGQYVIGNAVPGTYEISVETAGFKKAVAAGVLLQIAQAATRDFTMEVGAVETSVQVSAAEPPLQTVDSSLGNVISDDSIKRLPNLGRQAGQLLTLQPGATLTGEVAGARYDQTSIMLDGIAVQDMQNGSAFRTSTPTPVESVEEFRVIVSNPNATMSGTSGGQIVLQTKRGTNAFHGSVYEFPQRSVGRQHLDTKSHRSSPARGT